MEPNAKVDRPAQTEAEQWAEVVGRVLSNAGLGGGLEKSGFGLSALCF